jgi:hypothetical protein
LLRKIICNAVTTSCAQRTLAIEADGDVIAKLGNDGVVG